MGESSIAACREDGLLGGSSITAERMDWWVGLVVLQRGWTVGWV